MDKTWMQELKESPTSMFLLALSAYLVYKIGCDLLRKDEPPPKPLEPLKQDMTLNELKKYTGLNASVDNRICLGIKDEIFEVTRGKNFYGPDGPYSCFAGREASRCFATFSTDEDDIPEGRDDLSDLTSDQKSSLNDWYENISSKYPKVGKVIYTPEDEIKKTK